MLQPPRMGLNFPIKSSLLSSTLKGCMGEGDLFLMYTWLLGSETSSGKALMERDRACALALARLFLTYFRKTVVSCLALLQATCRWFWNESPGTSFPVQTEVLGPHAGTYQFPISLQKWMDVPGTSLCLVNLNYQSKHARMESASGLVVLLIISPFDWLANCYGRGSEARGHLLRFPGSCILE